jgi:hypothetical protein
LNESQMPMVECHKDDSVDFSKMLLHISFHGIIWGRQVKPICFGHDGCIVKQVILTGKSWKDPNGETAVAPNDDGAGAMIRMISAFQSCKFGFVLHLKDDQPKEVDNYYEGKFNIDTDEAMATRQSKQKNHSPLHPLSKSLNMEKQIRDTAHTNGRYASLMT